MKPKRFDGLVVGSGAAGIGAPTAVVVSSHYRWVVCAVCWAAFTLSFIDRLAWGNLQLQVGQSLGVSLAALGVFVSAFYGGYVISNAATGFVSDVWGPRLVLAISAALLGLATFLFGSVTSLAMGLAIQLVMGISAGADYAACVKLLTTWFPPRQRGRVIGIWYTGSSLAVVFTNALVPALAARWGWAGAYHVLGGVTLLLGVLCWVLLRDGPEARAASAPASLKGLLRNKNILLVSLAGFGALWGTWGFAFWSNALMVRGHGLAPAQAATIVALFGLGAAVAKPVIGLLSDWLGGRRKPIALACLAGFVAMLFVFGSLETETAFRIAAPFLGVAAFGYSPMLTALVAELAGKNSAGSASGVTNAFWQLGSLIVPVVVGVVFQATGSFLAAFAALACGPLLAFVALLAVREQPAQDTPAAGQGTPGYAAAAVR